MDLRNFFLCNFTQRFLQWHEQLVIKENTCECVAGSAVIPLGNSF